MYLCVEGTPPTCFDESDLTWWSLEIIVGG